MYKVYENHEICKGHQDTLMANGINPAKVKLVAETDGRNNLPGNWQAVPTIMDTWIYVLYEEEKR